MGDFEFIDPLRKSKKSHEVLDFQQYVYNGGKENGSEELKKNKSKERVHNENHIDIPNSTKTKKKKLKRVLHSSSSEEDTEEDESSKITKKNKKQKKKEKEKKAKKRRIKDDDEENSTDEDMNDSNEERENERREYEASLNHLFECILVSLRTKKKLIRVFSSNKSENKSIIANEFSKGSCRINNCDVNYEMFESQVDTFTKLKNYQKCGIFWLYTLYTENKNGILADEMGLGKTAQTCVFLEFMYKTQKLKNKTIVVAPTSLLKNWDHEIDMWCPFLKNHKIIYYGSQSERRDLAYYIFSKKKNPEEGENEIHLIITSIHMLMGKSDISYFRQIKMYDYLIFDEAHFLKNKNSIIYKQLQTRIFFNYKILLTGSPIQNKTEELTNLLLFLMPDIFKERSVNYAMNAFIQLYEKIVCEKDNIELDESIQSYKSLELHEPNLEEEKGNGAVLPENTREIIKHYIIETIKKDVKYTESKNKEIMLLQLIIEPYILRRSKKHVFVDMPKKHSIIVKLPMNQTQLKLYKHEILSRERHTHKHLEFIQKHANKKELQKLNTILGKKESKKEIKENNIELEQSESIGTNEGTFTTSLTNVSSEMIENEAKNYELQKEEKEKIEDDEEEEEEEEETINIENTDDNKNADIVINTRDDESELEEIEKNTGKETRGKMINALIFILRRICNHPLLHKYYYSVDDIKYISKYFYKHTDQYADLDLKTVETEFMKISDFDIHLSIKHLISQGDTNLNKYLISKEHILNSAKIHHMMNLLKEIRKKKEKVLIFSQFTTFLDIIEEALLYEFIYDDNVEAEQIQRTNSVKKETEHEKESIPNDSEKNEDTEEKQKEKKEEGEGEGEGEGETDEKDNYVSSSTYSTSKFSTDGSFQNDIYVRLDGSTHTVERQKMIKKFTKNDNIFVFLLSTKAGGVGLNLIAANHVILMDQDWNPHNDRQAEDRVHRLGQQKEVFIYRLCCTNTIEETILKCCKAKLHLDQAFGGNSELLQSALIKDALSCVE